MSAMAIRFPDDKHLRLKRLAKSRHLSINKLVEELNTSVLSAHDAEVRFRALALKGNPKKRWHCSAGWITTKSKAALLGLLTLMEQTARLTSRPKRTARKTA